MEATQHTKDDLERMIREAEQADAPGEHGGEHPGDAIGEQPAAPSPAPAPPAPPAPQRFAPAQHPPAGRANKVSFASQGGGGAGRLITTQVSFASGARPAAPRAVGPVAPGGVPLGRATASIASHQPAAREYSEATQKLREALGIVEIEQQLQAALADNAHLRSHILNGKR